MIADRYQLSREIGRGGMGAVWLGRDTLLGRDVALKRIGLMPGAQSPDLERAEREARLAARLNHPHVVAIYDLVDDGEDTWLVMEYVEGITLSALVKRDGALSPDQARPLVRQAADALAAAHGAGIVHRDVKPSNMLVTPAGEVKLTDFGIARAEADASLTQTGLVTGSPAYLAPEVASGATATDAADVWSLGATLFHLLAGHPPYDVTDNVMGALYRIVHEEPPRLSDAGPLAVVLEQTMARDPRDRWSMAQVRDVLGQGPEASIHPLPASAVAVGDHTRTLRSVPSGPVAVPPVALVPDLAPSAAPSTPATRPVRRRSAWPWVAAVAVLIAVALVAGAAYLGSRDDGRPSASGPSTSSDSGHSTSTGADEAARMRSFITTYLQTVTSDRQAGWAMLTPSFQRTSNGFAGYQGFWGTIRSATARDISPDPAAMTVSYGVDYVKTDGSRSSGQVTLRLVRKGSTYLIDGES
ncbi:MAG TPA: serine/threonine-protein kinase [Nocardioides sp.]|uniref:serine/threonine-protein kinase n=1 Tax=Nocardioides sp. TaxID=35761 RepID=UPI002E358F23|nr:serine/threonine-protein kinase [Nocardioides sp.]HEX3929865.1 serine/threonine-protein kinase [Nocardioides sp.]